jgi:hypothetical protein
VFVDGVDDGDDALGGCDVLLDVVVAGKDFEELEALFHDFAFLEQNQDDQEKDLLTSPFV